MNKDETIKMLHTELTNSMEKIKDLRFEVNNLSDNLASMHELIQQLLGEEVKF